MINRRIARRYTTALYEIGAEAKSLDKMQTDFSLIRKTIESSKDLQVFLKSPIINSEKKSAVLTDLFKGNIGDTADKLIELLCEKHRESFLHDIAVDFEDVINEHKGISEVKITTAIEINEDEKKNLVESLKKRLGKDLLPSFTVDTEIKGGFIAQVKDTIIDASIRHQLDNLRKQLTSGSFNN